MVTRIQAGHPRVVLIGAAVQLLVLVPALPATGQAGGPSSPPTTGGCEFRQAVCSGLGTAGRDAPRSEEPKETDTTQTVRRSDRRYGPSPYRRDRTYIEYELGGMAASVPSAQGRTNRIVIPGSGFCTDPATGERGVSYVDTIVRRTSGEVVSRRDGCEVQPGPRRRSPVPPQPEVPAPKEIWENVPLPVPEWGLNPSGNGLTGLQTWLWDPNGGAPVSATVALAGFTATATARPVRWEWRMWERSDTPNVNPHPLVISMSPGSQERPAGKYMYETNGEYTLTATVVWAGSYTLSGPGISETVDLGTTSTSSSRRYQVISVRGARVG